MVYKSQELQQKWMAGVLLRLGMACVDKEDLYIGSVKTINEDGLWIDCSIAPLKEIFIPNQSCNFNGAEQVQLNLTIHELIQVWDEV